MKRKLEDVLDQALDQLKEGASLEAVLFNFAEYKEELLPLLAAIQPGIRLPLNEVPKPALQRKYLATHPTVHVWNKYLSFTKLALMPLSVVLVFCAAFTAQANPGQTLLYGFKQAVKKAPLALIRNPDVRAAKELEISEKSLNEAEKFLNSGEDASVQANVVANLAKQTSETVASVKELAKESAINGKNPELLNKLVTITQKQEKLVNAVKAPEDEPEKAEVLEEGKQESTKTAAVVNSLVATVNEQVLASLKEEASAAVEAKPKPVETAKTAAPAKAEKAPARAPEEEAPPEVIEEEPAQSQVSGNFILEYPAEEQE